MNKGMYFTGILAAATMFALMLFEASCKKRPPKRHAYNPPTLKASKNPFSRHPPNRNESKIPGGCSVMGEKYIPSIHGTPQLFSRSDLEKEYHPHKVCLDPYYIDRYEVTIEQYKKCVKAGVCKPPQYGKCEVERKTRNGSYPVRCVSWYQAVVYCKWLGKRLPTEAEWERAGRALDRRVFPWGNSTKVLLAYMKTLPYQKGGRRFRKLPLVPVGARTFDVSSYGVYDLAGNVSEWVSDCIDLEYYPVSPVNNPLGVKCKEDDDPRVLRGGNDETGRLSELRLTYRTAMLPFSVSQSVGFRCAR